MSAEFLDAMMIVHWSEPRRAAEPERTQQTWFDYRFLHPALRAQHFYHRYLDTTKEWVEKNYYSRKYQPFRNTTPNLYRHSRRNVAAVVSAMHTIDKLCMPYGLFLENAISHWMQERGYTYSWRGKTAGTTERDLLPPLRLLTDRKTLIAAAIAFDRRCLWRVIMPEHPVYLASNWAEQKAQQDFARFLCTQVKRRPPREHDDHLQSLVFERNLLTLPSVEAHFGAETRARIEEMPIDSQL
jgi:hypothetical protein